jgi:broad specificity phosphatase PhoE
MLKLFCAAKILNFLCKTNFYYQKFQNSQKFKLPHPMYLDLYLVRHAQSEGNRQLHLIGGQSNHLPLSPQGIAQAQRLGQRLSQQQLKMDLVFSSTALRSQQTAELALQQHYQGQIQYSEQLLELSQGQWEGQLRAEMHSPQVLQAMQEQPWDFKAPGGESQREVEERLYRWLEQSLLPLVPQQEPPLCAWVFSHGMAIKCLTRRLLGSAPSETYKMFVENTSITQFHYRPSQGWSLRRFNDYAHLEGLFMP